MPSDRLLPPAERDRGGCAGGYPQSDALNADHHHGAEAFRAHSLRSGLYSQVLRVSDAPCGRGVAGVAAGELHSGREVPQRGGHGAECGGRADGEQVERCGGRALGGAARRHRQQVGEEHCEAVQGGIHALRFDFGGGV